MLSRMIGCALLRSQAYEEVEADRSATIQAMAVVIVAALAYGVGNMATGGLYGLLFGVAGGLAGWGMWAWITYLVGTTLFRTPETHANWGEMARTMGFAQSPGILLALGILPGIGLIFVTVASVWTLVAMVIAIRQALDYRSTWWAIGVAVVGFIAWAVLSAVIRSVF